MADGVTFIGGEKLVLLAVRLRGSANKELRRELTKGLNRATKPLRQTAKASAVARLPHRGGLGKRVSRTRMVTRIKIAANPSVEILAKPGAVADPRRIDRGRVKHPVWGRGPWVLQDVTPGWFTEPMEQGAPIVRPELVKVMNVVGDAIARGL